MDEERTEQELIAYDSIDMSYHEYDGLYPCLKDYEHKRYQYAYATWLMDVTGWRLIDEILHITAYMPNSQFSNYILPKCNLNIYTQRLYKLNVLTQMNGFRKLKNLGNNEIIKTKTENRALLEFLTWLEENNGEHDGIILVSYERNEKMPVILLAALERNQLLNRFKAVVKGFANMYNIINDKYNSLNSSLIKSFEQKSESSMRTKTWYDLLMNLNQTHEDTSGEGDNIELLPKLVEKVLKSTELQKEKLDDVTINIQKKNAWKPLFCDALVSGRRNRSHASNLRKDLIEKNVEFSTLKSAYKSGGKDAVSDTLVKLNISETNSRNIAQLVDCYFNSEQRIILPREWSTPVFMPKSLNNIRKNTSLQNESDAVP